MKRGLQILIGWLIVGGILAAIIAPSVPVNGFKSVCERLVVISFPLAAWFYARHGERLFVVLVYGLIAGTFSILIPLSFLYNTHGEPGEISPHREILILIFPVLMALFSACVFSLRRFLDKKR